MLRRHHVLDPRAHLWTDDELSSFGRHLGLRADRACHVVDLGCGWGALGLALALRYPRIRVTGVDLDEDLVALGGDVARAAGLHRRVRWRIEDVVDIDAWADLAPDVAVCQALLVHTPRPADWLSDLAASLPPGTSVGLVESDAVVRAMGLRDSITDPEPAYRRLRVAVTDAVARGARSLGVDRRFGTHLAATLAAAGFHHTATREIHQPPIPDPLWLEQRIKRRLREGLDPIDTHFALAAGLHQRHLDTWLHLRHAADRRRLTALSDGPYFRQESGFFMGWGVV